MNIKRMRLNTDKMRLALICMKYFCNFTALNGSPGTHKRKYSINKALYFWRTFLLEKCQKAQVSCIPSF